MSQSPTRRTASRPKKILIKQKDARTHISNCYEEPLLAFVDTIPFGFEDFAEKMGAFLDVNQNYRFSGRGNESMHALLMIFLKEYGFKKIFPHDLVVFDFTVNRNVVSSKVYISVWHPSRGFIWQNKKKCNDISFIVKEDASIVRAKYGTLWTDQNGVLLGR